ncbi:MAG: hypothetical protein QNJ46_16430 [Leptolyngbyaceae cyanobacterium MO_188.B28]|nr:hypothetical protein [Leptolyngbyaceae cyanobacterium MO_188.B28]
MTIIATTSLQPSNFNLQSRNSIDGPIDLSPKQLKHLGDSDGYFATPSAFLQQNVHYIHGYCEGFLRRIASIAQGSHPSTKSAIAPSVH